MPRRDPRRSQQKVPLITCIGILVAYFTTIINGYVRIPYEESCPSTEPVTGESIKNPRLDTEDGGLKEDFLRRPGCPYNGTRGFASPGCPGFAFVVKLDSLFCYFFVNNKLIGDKTQYFCTKKGPRFNGPPFLSISIIYLIIRFSTVREPLPRVRMPSIVVYRPLLTK